MEKCNMHLSMTMANTWEMNMHDEINQRMDEFEQLELDELEWLEQELAQVELDVQLSECESCWLDAQIRDEDEDDITITLDSRDGKIVHSVLFDSDTISAMFDKKARFRQKKRNMPEMYRNMPTEPKVEKARPDKPLCRKGEICVNKKCTFVHPN